MLIFKRDQKYMRYVSKLTMCGQCVLEKQTILLSSCILFNLQYNIKFKATISEILLFFSSTGWKDRYKRNSNWHCSCLFVRVAHVGDEFAGVAEWVFWGVGLGVMVGIEEVGVLVPFFGGVEM